MKIKYLPIIASAASFGAPVAYVLFAFITSLRNGQEIHLSMIGTMFLTAYFFSFLATEALALITMTIAHIIRPRRLNILVVSVASLLALCILVTTMYGLLPSAVFTGLACSNALLFVIISKIEFGTMTLT